MTFLKKHPHRRRHGKFPVAIVASGAVAVLILIIAAYFFFSKDKAKSESASETEVVSSGLDADQKVKNVGDVEEVIAKWIEANPQAVINSLQNMQRKAQEEQLKNAQKNIGSKKDELFKDKNSPEVAPAGYDVTIVEFFDYGCGYCKKAQATVDALLKEDKKVRVVYKEFPILGAPSTEMATAAIAVHLNFSSSYKKFHDALMKSQERGKAAVSKAAKAAGIDADKLEKVLKSDASKIEKILQENLALGSSIGINGTPGFVIGEELIPGALELEALKQKVAAARAAK